jgi:hypothetical protein
MIAPVEREDLAASGVRVTIGPHSLDFVAPRGPDGPLTGWLAARGPSPFAVTLATTGAKGPLPLDKTMAARLSLG